MTSTRTKSGRPTAIDQQKLLATAEALFAERGFDGVSTRELCEKIGCNLAMISYYFGSKEGLYQTVITEKIKCLAARAEPAGKNSATPETQLFKTLLSIGQSILANKNFHRIVMREMMCDSKRMIHALKESDLGAFGLLVKKLNTWKTQKVLSKDFDTKIAVVTLLGPIFHSMISRPVIVGVYGLSKDEEIYMTSLCKHLSKTFFKAWGATRS